MVLNVSPKRERKNLNLNINSHLYNIQRNDDFKHRRMKLIWNNKLFPYLNATNGKMYP